MYRLSKEELEEKLGYSISQEKYTEINNLDFIPAGKAKDFSFQTFTRLFVLGRKSKNLEKPDERPRWWCICSCPEHNIVDPTSDMLSRKITQSCKCLQKESRRMTGRKYTFKHTLEWYSENARKANAIRWRNPEAHISKNFKDIKGQLCGGLIPEVKTDKRDNNRNIIWECYCIKCKTHGHEFSSRILLKENPPLSCGCMRLSKGASKIQDILEQANIPFKQEVTFETCRFKDTNRQARFDFYVDNKFLIEYDGEQHFIETKKFNNNKDNLLKRQWHDDYKTQWCQENNIPLIRIRYDEIDAINTIDDILKLLKE